jgi:uncharacterized protein (DUF1330 family)
MAAYIIVQVDVLDAVGYEEYKKLAPSSIAQYGGKYLVRGGKLETLEGNWKPNRLVILEFESLERAKEWWSCEEYRLAKHLRHKTAESQMIVVEGSQTAWV